MIQSLLAETLCNVRRHRLPRPAQLGLLMVAMLVCPASSSCAAVDVVNILANAGFEDGLPEPWRVYHTGELKVVRDPDAARDGSYFATVAWRKHAEGAYSALCSPQLTLYPGISYELGVWAKGRGAVSLWVVQQSKSGKFMGTDFGRSWTLTDDWCHLSRTWIVPEGIHRAHLFLKIDEHTVADLDDVLFGYDRSQFTPPEAETLRVTSQVSAADATFSLTLNGQPLTSPTKIVYGEHVLGLTAEANGPDPRLSGAILFGAHEVKLDARWRGAPIPDDDSWAKPGFDDGKWRPARADNDVWEAGGDAKIALRRVVLWKSQRRDPWRENQWVAMMRDRMFVAEESAGAFVTIIPTRANFPARELILHVEAPAFMKLLDRFEKGTHFYSNYGYRKASAHEVKRGGTDYVHYELTYDVPTETRWRAFAPLYFKAADGIERNRPYSFTFWRETNGNITDVPTVLPITVVGSVNGRQCDHFHLTYNRPTLLHSGGFGTFSVAERNAMADTLIAAGMNVAWASNLSEKNGVLDYWRSLKSRNVQLVWGFNFGMNWPSAGRRPLLEAHPELNARFYRGPKEAFEKGLGRRWRDMTGKAMWCQEYCATGGRLFYDALRPRIEEAREELGEILYTMWDWEYATFAWSCFCPRCISAFRTFAQIPGEAQLTDQVIVSQYPQRWIDFRLDQSARHMRSMMKFCKEYGTTLTNWHPGASIKAGDFDYSLVGDIYEYHFMGWPGSDLPLLGAGRRGRFAAEWRKLSPDIHLAGQTIVDFFPSHVIDERMFKIWTLNVALGTAGGGWVIWLDSMYPLPQTHGMSYFMGEATRLIHEFEDFFTTNRHIEAKFKQGGLEGRANELIALESSDGKAALVLLFNQSDRDAQVTVSVQDRSATWRSARQWEGKKLADPRAVTVVVPEKDVVALRYE